MKLFMGDWVIKVFAWIGMEEGEAIEDKRITKGILKSPGKRSRNATSAFVKNLPGL